MLLLLKCYLQRLYSVRLSLNCDLLLIISGMCVYIYTCQHHTEACQTHSKERLQGNLTIRSHSARQQHAYLKPLVQSHSKTSLQGNLTVRSDVARHQKAYLKPSVQSHSKTSLQGNLTLRSDSPRHQKAYLKPSVQCHSKNSLQANLTLRSDSARLVCYCNRCRLLHSGFIY